MDRYKRNIGTVTAEEQELLKSKSVCVVGCGGIGGGVIESLTRMGIGHLTVMDGDVFDETNLNRQVLSNENVIGHPKALEAAKQMGEINSEIEIVPVYCMLDEGNAFDIVKGHDVVIDALDNVETRSILSDACDKAGIPLVHGAIGGWNGQVGIVMPGCKMIDQLYGDGLPDTDAPTNPPFTPAVIAAMEASETVKLLLGKKEALKNRLLMIDLLNNEYDTIDFDL